jgi:hypothetical protein
MPTYQVEIKGTLTIIRAYKVKAKNKKEAEQLGWEKFTEFEEPEIELVEHNEDDEVVGVNKI